MAFPDFTICLEAATQWHETAGPQRLRHPPTRANGDKESLDKAQVFIILSVEGYSVIKTELKSMLCCDFYSADFSVLTFSLCDAQIFRPGDAARIKT